MTHSEKRAVVTVLGVGVGAVAMLALVRAANTNEAPQLPPAPKEIPRPAPLPAEEPGILASAADSVANATSAILSGIVDIFR